MSYVQLCEYFAGNRKEFQLPIMLQGTDFMKSVWTAIAQIPYGETMTYGEIADRVADKRGLKTMSGQAVGGAVGHNPISIIVPCHRVVPSHGGTGGFAYGENLKKFLLNLENSRSYGE